MILAVLLSSFLLFSVFTVGLTYLKMNKLQNIRLNGADFDAVLYGVTEEQKTILDNDENVKQFGILTVAGAVRETETDKTPGVGLLYADAVLWDDMMSPTRTFLQGKYPTDENEIMVTEEALKKCGFENKKQGMKSLLYTKLKRNARRKPSRSVEYGVDLVLLITFLSQKLFVNRKELRNCIIAGAIFLLKKDGCPRKNSKHLLIKWSLENLSDCSMYTNSAMLQKYSGESQESWLLPV